MKKLALFLLAFLMVVAGIFHTTRPTIASKNEEGGGILQLKDAAPLSSFLKNDTVVNKTVVRSFEAAPPAVEEVPIEENRFRDVLASTFVMLEQYGVTEEFVRKRILYKYNRALERHHETGEL